ncbi:hypothetical protein BCEP4_420004 [Burkholderia cepacia]|nr:hypothetical protein BCEP4_420004 [Burkholderia cepacia]
MQCLSMPAAGSFRPTQGFQQ